MSRGLTSVFNTMGRHIGVDDRNISQTKEISGKVSKLLGKNPNIIHTAIQPESGACEEKFNCSL